MTHLHSIEIINRVVDCGSIKHLGFSAPVAHLLQPSCFAYLFFLSSFLVELLVDFRVRLRHSNVALTVLVRLVPFHADSKLRSFTEFELGIVTQRVISKCLNCFLIQ